ncbi:elongation factor P hydroxylase [Psychrobacter sp.]|uniref:elongation factor P hydroxylase n=1 Tax=Psychrobacter sp. TaxID=56811 RepID=UPI0025E35C29|nr:elongation factor P hydroxylase [Psychrobacter sp.]
MNDNKICAELIRIIESLFSELTIIGGANEPYYKAPKDDSNAIIYYRDNYLRSLLHELAHYCLAGKERRKLNDYGYWYNECGRTEEEQILFEVVEARPQGLEKAMCEVIGIGFSPSLDDFSGRPPSDSFLQNLQSNYLDMISNPPPLAEKVLDAMKSSLSSSK